MARKYLLIFIAIAIVALAIVGYKTLYPESRNILKEEAAHQITALSLFEHFSEEKGAQFIDQAIITTGRVTEIDQQSIFLDHKVQINLLDTPHSAIQIEDYLTIKGRCIGYDDLLEIVKIDQATITN
ncbi:hypothetical protein [Flagellimonas flava]|uniref:hypothetical protein n=1 Tax=Flagellimonas flava TaxID=570519 RepID=UPI003D660824